MVFPDVLPGSVSAPEPPARFSQFEIVSFPEPVGCGFVVARLTVTALDAPAYVTVSPVPAPQSTLSLSFPVPGLSVSFPLPPVKMSAPA